MAQIEATFVVEPYDITVTTDSSNLVVSPTVLDVNIFSAGYSNPAGNNGELQYNNGGLLGGVPIALYTGGNIVFANVTNVKLPGGSNTYFLQTDGTGNITWAPGTVNANTGNGVANGANTQIQFTDGTGNFRSAAGFTFNYVGNTLTVPGPGIFTGNIQSGNANLGNAAVANYFIGNGAYLTGIDPSTISNGNSNVKVYANGNIGFSSNGVANVGIMTTNTFSIAGNVNVTNQLISTVGIGTPPLSVISSTKVANLNVDFIDGYDTSMLSAAANTVVVRNSDGNIIANNITGTLVTANQYNITNVGTLGVLTTAGNTNIGNLVFGAEKVNIIGAQTGTYNFDVLDGCIRYSNANATANLTINFRGNSTTSFSSVITANQSLTATYIVTTGSNAYGITAVQVDGSAKTIRWSGNVIPTQIANTCDTYIFTLIGTGSDYLVFGSKSRFG